MTVSRRHLAQAQPAGGAHQAGCANAATGAQGEADAVASAEGLARELGLATEEVVVLSTGVIGAPLPVDKVLAGARAAAAELSADGGEAAAGAILTTDSGPKVAVASGAGSRSAGWRRAPG